MPWGCSPPEGKDTIPHPPKAGGLLVCFYEGTLNVRNDNNVMRLLLTVGIVITSFGVQAQKGAGSDPVHTPRKGSAEEQSILKALRTKEAVRFKVDFLKVHHGWAWADVTPLDTKGKPIAEGGPNLLHLKAGHWETLDLSKVPADPDDPMGAEDASAGFVKNLRKRFPGVPADIFPKPTH
ncbi:MAG: hypothetical protein JWL77_3865 [Chthonomonadaceae bacterium]|nr:hypothetical protein [Chthonomonadaceae bacterium]